MTTPFAILVGDAREVLRSLPTGFFHCCVTSPPYYGLRDYSDDPRQVGYLQSLPEYITSLVDIFNEVRRVLRPDGTLWLNVGDSYASRRTYRHPKTNAPVPIGWRPPIPDGLKDKDLIGVPWRLAFALQEQGWWLRNDVIWEKSNAKPESVRDRAVRVHEYVFQFSTSSHYFYDDFAVREGAIDGGSRSRRTIWRIATRPRPAESTHRAPMPEELVDLCVLSATAPGACEACGAPWERDVERVRMLDGEPVGAGHSMFSTSLRDVHARQGVGHWRYSTRVEDKGWRWGCDCGGGHAPCVVLDPFGGSMTTGASAMRLGRAFVGVELNATYAQEGHARLLRAEKGAA